MGYYLDAALYDLVYADVVADIEPWVAEARAAGGLMLEVACGTGRLLAPTLAAGVACDGVDLEPAMLARCRDRLAAQGLATTLVQGDMRTLALPGRYARIAIGFNSFLHNLTQADQLATLRACRAHLLPGGSLQLHVFHPSAEALLKWAGPERLSREGAWGDTGDRIQVYDQAEDDRVEQVRHMMRRVLRVAPDGAVRDERRMTFALRYIYKPEMELLLRVAGFARSTVRPACGSLLDGGSVRRPDDPPREGDTLIYTAWTA